MGDRLPLSSGLYEKSVSAAGMLKRLPILPAKAQWVGSVSMNDDRCENWRRRLTILIIGDCRRLEKKTTGVVCLH